MQHQAVEMHQLALDPQGGAGIGKMMPFDPCLRTNVRSDHRVAPRSSRVSVAVAPDQRIHERLTIWIHVCILINGS